MQQLYVGVCSSVQDMITHVPLLQSSHTKRKNFSQISCYVYARCCHSTTLRFVPVSLICVTLLKVYMLTLHVFHVHWSNYRPLKIPLSSPCAYLFSLSLNLTCTNICSCIPNISFLGWINAKCNIVTGGQKNQKF